MRAVQEAERLVALIRAKGARLTIPLSALAAGATGVAQIVLESVQEMLLKLALQIARDDYENGTEVSGEFFEILAPPRPANRSNRVKYRCPSCHVQVWGKPSLKLRCGEAACEAAAFEAVE
ncbi:hypothetical protein [Thauera butanivorans]|uniref:hypothetical protein n=1 Tax=Thauera butanivorans TaxID=86174 RepID=UPI000838C2DC